jgi:Protein of unknown function (DUF664)
VTSAVDKPDRQLADPKELLLGFLDYYRSWVARLIEDLPDDQLRSSRLPSGWTPLDMLKHLVFMENRWLRWGFRAEQIPDPHGDKDQAGRWHAGPEESPSGLIAALYAAGERTRAIAAKAELTDISASGGRFNDGDPFARPTLAWILTYVLQEYAAHAGQLDVARELSDGTPSISIRRPGGQPQP